MIGQKQLAEINSGGGMWQFLKIIQILSNNKNEKKKYIRKMNPLCQYVFIKFPHKSVEIGETFR